MKLTCVEELDWAKGDGQLLPAIVQDTRDGTVLMAGYMTREALAQTLTSNRVTFWSRTKQRLWTKGESSGHGLELVAARTDCDRDAILLTARPHGPTCHTGTRSCFDVDGEPVQDVEAPGDGPHQFLQTLQDVIASRLASEDHGSYTRKLVAEGPRRVAQKIGEEGVEVALAAVMQGDEELLGESADLVFHLMVMLQSRGLLLSDVVRVLETRHRETTSARA